MMKRIFSNILFSIPAVKRFAEKQFLSFNQKRLFAGAKVSRLVNDWITELEAINTALKYEFRQLLARSRELAANNEYVKGFLNRCVTNIVGHNGFTLQNRALRNDEPDDRVNILIENKWYEWGSKKYCSINKDLSFIEMQKLAVKMWKRDGNVLVRKIVDPENKFGFSLQLIDIDSLALKYNDTLNNGNEIIMGKEYNRNGNVVAYWLYINKPTSELLRQYSYNINAEAVRIPAEEILHFYIKDYPGQVLGLPEVTQSLLTLHNLRGYDEGVIINARAGAYKMGFIQSQPNQSISVQYDPDKVDSDGNMISEFTPGIIEKLPEGLEFKGWDPTYPHGEYVGYVKSVLRRIATGIGVAYANWVGDLEAVNFSSMRSGLLDERDNWKNDQTTFIEGFLLPIFNEWLKYAILSKQINLSFADYERVNQPEFIGRRWDWVDPSADIEAKVMAVNNNMMTLSDVMAEMGVDFEDYIRRRKRELEKLKEIKMLEQELFPDKGGTKSNKTNPPANGNNGNGKSLIKCLRI